MRVCVKECLRQNVKFNLTPVVLTSRGHYHLILLFVGIFDCMNNLNAYNTIYLYVSVLLYF